MNTPPMPKTASPATPKPITEPPVNDTFRAFIRLVRAASVVRTLAFVAMFIPKYPASAEKNAPTIKHTAITQLLSWLEEPRRTRRSAAIIAK